MSLNSGLRYHIGITGRTPSATAGVLYSGLATYFPSTLVLSSLKMGRIVSPLTISHIAASELGNGLSCLWFAAVVPCCTVWETECHTGMQLCCTQLIQDSIDDSRHGGCCQCG